MKFIYKYCYRSQRLKALGRVCLSDVSNVLVSYERNRHSARAFEEG